MAGNYYTARHATPPLRDREVDDDFWGVYRYYLQDLADRGYLAESFSEVCPDGPFIHDFDRRKLEARLKRAVGHGTWPLPPRRQNRWRSSITLSSPTTTSRRPAGRTTILFPA